MDESNAPGNRRARRSNVLLSATIEVGGIATSVKLRNLSEQGALIEGESLPLEGTEVIFRRKELSVAGRVAWVSGAHAGIAFSAPLTPQDVLRNIPQPKPRIHADYRRPALNPRVMSAQERVAMDHWLALMAMRRP